ncbi:MAG: prepilin-type N-terminal cleavage/methylation domain-containing protein [Coriobacteriales bacterium]|nr:prepilin-type N-terminal cleavage/methylation domain-containing protein [Coriobacteriales bacterium]
MTSQRDFTVADHRGFTVADRRRVALAGHRGFTLIELIVTLSISVILIALAGSLIVFSMNFLNRTEVRASDKHLAEQSADFIKERLLYANSISLVRATEPPSSASGGDILFIGQLDPATNKITITNEGHLYYMRAGDSAPVDVFGTGGYDNNALAFSYRAIVDETNRTDKSFEITTKTIRDSMVAYTSKKTFSLYEAGASADAEPRKSVSVDSWSDGADFDASTEKFYLLVNTTSSGYVQTGLIAWFDAINNDGTGSMGSHNPNQKAVWSDLTGNGNDMNLFFTNNSTPIRNTSIYFDGSGDYGMIPQLDLSDYSSVTVEICFREADTGRAGLLFEYSSNGATQATGFGSGLNSTGSKDSSDNIACTFFHWTNDAGSSGLYVVNHKWINQSTAFTTHTNFYSMIQGDTQRMVWIDGAPVGLIAQGSSTTPINSSTNTHATDYFVKHPFFIAIRGGTSSADVFAGEISSIRIYGRQLTQAEIQQNAQEDYVRFGR